MKPVVRYVLAVFAIIFSLAMIALWLDSGPHDQPRSSASNSSGVTAGESSTIAAGALYVAKFNDTNGRSQPLAQWHDKLLVVNFWATWCAPCKEEMPLFSRMQEKHAANGLQIVGIAADSVANVKTFQKATPISYPLFPDESGALNLSKRLGNRFGLLPHTVIFAPKGSLVFAKLGLVTESELEGIFFKYLPKYSN